MCVSVSVYVSVSVSVYVSVLFWVCLLESRGQIRTDIHSSKKLINKTSFWLQLVSFYGDSDAPVISAKQLKLFCTYHWCIQNKLHLVVFFSLLGVSWTGKKNLPQIRKALKKTSVNPRNCDTEGYTDMHNYEGRKCTEGSTDQF